MIAGEGPAPALVLLMVQRLPDDSMTSALAAGGSQFFGWGMDRMIAAHLYDAVNQNTRACGNWGKKGPPKIPEFPRPKAKATTKRDGAAKKRVGVADLYSAFTRR